LPPLSARVTDKVEKAAAFVGCEFDQVWLLVWAQVNSWGATGSTWITKEMVDVADLNTTIAPILSGSKFTRTFLFLGLEKVVYGWTSQDQQFRELAGISA
jgi:hypothetical protein